MSKLFSHVHGIFALQDFSWQALGASPFERSLLAAVRVTGRKLDGTFIYDDQSVGDLPRFMCWKPISRPLAQHTEVMPCITTEPDNVTTPSGNFWEDTSGQLDPIGGIGNGDTGPVTGPGGDIPVKKAPGSGGTDIGNGQIFIPGGPDKSLLPPGFVGYYSPGAGGWVGSFQGPSSDPDSTKDANSVAPKATSKSKGPDTVIQPAIAGFSNSDHPAGAPATQTGGGPTLGVIDSNDSLAGPLFGIQRNYAWPTFSGGYYQDPTSGGGWTNNGQNWKVPASPSKGGGSKPTGYTVLPNGGGVVFGPGFSGTKSTSIVKAVVPDTSMRQILVDTDQNSVHSDWSAFPKGTKGLAVSMGGLGEQIIDFFPTDPRLCSVNKGGATDCGTLVSDVYPSAFWDTSRSVPLQALTRVIKAASPTGSTLALNIGYSGQGDCLGGLFIDSMGSGGKRFMGAVSVIDGGPFHCGGIGEQHHLGNDADGNVINSMHISTCTNIIGGIYDSVNDGGCDGPIRYDGRGGESKNEPPYKVNVKHYFDGSLKYGWVNGHRYGARTKKALSGMWIWQSFCFEKMTGPITPSRPPYAPDPPIGPPPLVPPWQPGTMPPPPGSKGPPYASFSGKIGAGQSQLMIGRTRGIGTAEISQTGFIGQPQSWNQGAPDLRYEEGWKNNRDVLDEHERTTPIVGRMAWLGAQGTTSATKGWVYTQKPGLSRDVAGTAAGLLAIMPPEVDHSDIEVNYAPAGVTISPVFLLTVPGARFASGLPEKAGGGVKSGWSFGPPTGVFSTDFTFSKHSSAGVATEFIRFSTQPSSNQVLAAPSTGAPGVATFRALVKADLPTSINTLVYANTSVPGGNTIANTGGGTETAFASTYTIPANSLTVGQVIRLRTRGVYSTALVAPTIIGRVRFGGVAGTLLITTGTVSALVGASSNLGWQADISITVNTIGGTGTMEVQGNLLFATAATAALTIIPVNLAAIAVDTTSPSDLVMTVEWGTASVDNTITLRQMTDEILG